MNELILVKSADFGEIQCDLYCDGKDFWMTHDQIGRALEYFNSEEAIRDIHSKYKETLNRFSRVAQIEGNGTQNTMLYNQAGVMEICGHSEQPKADDFMDFCWDFMSGREFRNKLMYNVWKRATCTRSIYDPWDYPQLAFTEGRAYRACHYEDGHWEVHSGVNETGHAVEFLEEEFNDCFRIKS